MSKKKQTTIKAWAIVFGGTNSIYCSLTDGKPLTQCDIFKDENCAKAYVEGWRDRELRKPQIVPCQIILPKSE